MKRPPQIDGWIEKFLEKDPPRAKSLVVTIFGDAIAPHGDSIWLQSLINLLRPFGVNERLVRSSVFRLVEEEWLLAERHGRQSRYGFTVSGRKRFERAHEKIYFAADRRWNGEWLLVIALPSRVPPQSRAALRRELEWEGFRGIGPGTFAHPVGERRAVAEIIERTRAGDGVVICSAREIERDGAGRLAALVSRHWDLRRVLLAYRNFIQHFGALLGMIPRERAIPAEQAFVIRTLVIHSFRRALLHDPLLPAELLPENWPGRKAYDLCRAIYQLTYLDSERYMHTILGPAAVPRPSAYFQDRFGGLPHAIQSRA